jgi:tetratricopeptide (TPR) repeat protein
MNRTTTVSQKPPSRRAGIGFALLLLVSAVAASAQSPAADCDKLMAAGVEAYNAGKFKDAEKNFQRALKLAEKIAPEDPRVANALANLGMTYMLTRRPDKAESFFKRSAALLEKDPAAHPREVAFVWKQLGTIYYLRTPGTRLGRASGTAVRSVVVTGPIMVTLPSNSPPTPPDASSIARDLQAQIDSARRQAVAENFPRAEQYFQKALALEGKHFGAESMELVPTLELLGDLCVATYHFAEGEAALRRALAIVERREGQSLRAADLQLSLAASAFRQKKYDEAEPLFQRALAIQEELRGPTHPDLVPTLQAYALLLKETGRKDHSKQLDARAKDILKRNPS